MYFLPGRLTTRYENGYSVCEISMENLHTGAGKISLIVCNSYGDQISTIELHRVFYCFIHGKLSDFAEA